jgi:predicted amidohydrolase YtcJ
VRTLYRASRVHTFSLQPSGEWILVDDRHVERVGTGDPPSADRIVEIPGSTIIPGLIDTHVHLTGTGVHLAHPEIASTRSPEELLGALAAAVAGRDRPTLVHGFDETTWRGGGALPSTRQLDDVTTVPVLVVRVDGHLSLANSTALELAGIADDPGVERRDGIPTGVVTLDANHKIKRWFSQQLSAGELQDLQLKAAGLAASRGITCVHEMSLPSERGIQDLEVLLGHWESLPVSTVTYVATTDIAQAIDLRLPRIGGDLPVDGSLGARTAALSGDYADDPEAGDGTASFVDDELAEFFHGAHMAGLQVGVHAIGDRAIEQVLMTWERVFGALDSRERRHFRARRHRIEHFEMATPVQIERAAMLGVTVSVQPAFDATWGFPGGLYDRRLGWDRAGSMNAFRSCLDRGIEMGVGSDSPVTALDPLAAIAALERHHDPAQRLSRAQALHLSTSGGAKLAHQENKKGALEPGMHADFAAFDIDPTSEPDIDGARPVLTVSIGREVWAA